MNFISWSFVVLFTIVLAARILMGRRKTERSFVWFTIIASTVFVMWHVPVYILILLTTVTIDYTAARIIDGARRDWRWRKAVLATALTCNLLLLGFFKYANFSLVTIEQSLNSLGWGVQLPRLSLVLPIGISFYTFGSMSYTIDVYRGRLRAIRRFQDFYYFVTFFPHMVAGPIIRARQFFYQLNRPRRLRLLVFNHAAFLIIRGLFLKMVCADNIARVVNIYWADAAKPQLIGTPLQYQGYSGELVVLAVLFSGQIFCDFEGYTSIARGLAYLLGYRFPINFRYPWIAGSFNDFWQRWHITLSSWLRDYLYIPLCGDLRRPVPLARAYSQYSVCHASRRLVAWRGNYICLLGSDTWSGAGPRKTSGFRSASPPSLVTVGLVSRCSNGGDTCTDILPFSQHFGRAGIHSKHCRHEVRPHQPGLCPCFRIPHSAGGNASVWLFGRESKSSANREVWTGCTCRCNAFRGCNDLRTIE